MGFEDNNDEDIPGGLPEEDLAEFLRRREKLRRTLTKDSALLHEFMDDLAADAVWKASIIAGSPLLVEAAIKGGTSVDTPLPGEACHPLISLSRLIPKTMQEANNHIRVAKCLIDHDAKLNIMDYKGLLPADYALLSVNTGLSREIVLSTLRLSTERDSNWVYRPNIKALFSTIRVEERESTHAVLERNLEAIRSGLEQAMQHGDHTLRYMSRTEIDFWRKAKAQPLQTLPGPTPAMVTQFDDVARMSKARAAGPLLNPQKISREEFEAAQDKMRRLEWEHARKFKPE